MIKKIFKKKKIILGIETSFDDTSCSILKGNKILSNLIYSHKLHTKYNGVVPNLAYKEHLKNIFNIVKNSIKKSNVNIKNIDGIAFTKGPGLIGSLIIGENFAKSLSMCLKKPLFGINHIHAHIFSHFFYKKNKKYPKFPFLCFSISGGHTKIIKVKNFFNLKVIGDTLDDTLGNLFDKLSIFLGFNYPKGPLILENLCKKGINKYKFPYPKVKKLNFSFSGLKTYFYNFIKKKKKKYIKNNISNISKSFHELIYKIIYNKIKKAIKITNIKNILFTGGVLTNNYIKKKIKKKFKNKKYNIYLINDKKILKDNAAMIALIGQIKYYYKFYDNLKIKSNPNLKLNNKNL